MGLDEISQSDLSSLVPPLQEGNIGDNEDILQHLSDSTSFEIDTFLSEFNPAPFIKVRIKYLCLLLEYTKT